MLHLLGPHVSDCGRCPLQVEGGQISEDSYFNNYHQTFNEHFSTHGLPEMLVTDNAYYFTSQEFQDFTKFNGI